MHQRRENLGLAAMRVAGDFARVEYTAICHIPLGGIDISAGYTAEDSFAFGIQEDVRCEFSALYSPNPTIQKMVSIEGHPLHLHGHAVSDEGRGHGGHINVALTASNTTVELWPLRDLRLQIRDLDVAWLPVAISASPAL